MDDNYQILWKRLDTHGLEECMAHKIDHHQILYGKSMFFEDEKICNLNYRVLCDMNWRSAGASVKGYIDEKEISVEIIKNGETWLVNNQEQQTLKNCSEIDLGFTPSTNLMPIKQMMERNLTELEIETAWLKFPELRFEPLEQRYTRLSDMNYSYESSNGIKTELQINEFGFVIDYPGQWVFISNE